MKVEGVGEFGLLEAIKPYLASARSIEVPPGTDDAAVIAESGGFTVASSDMFVEGVHFDLAWMSAKDAGWRSLTLALGDLAAKGATPTWALTSIAIPNTWMVENLIGMYDGMAEIAHRTQTLIAGGDMSLIDGPAVLSITVVGRTDRRPVARSESQPGWAVAVTGPLGASALALRERRPQRLLPRLDEGRRLNAAGLCCGDISDGLVREMQKFAAFSGAGCILQSAEIPVAEGATHEDALTSGEEAELVCVGPVELIRGAGLRTLGILTKDPAVHVVGPDGKPVDLKHSGYDHFA
jgi:thiamine-monophosphate kinase